MIILIYLFDNKVGRYLKYIFEGINFTVGYYLFTKQKDKYEIWHKLGGEPKRVIIPICIALVPIIIYLYIVVNNPFYNKEVYQYGSNDIYYTKDMNKPYIDSIIMAFIKMGIMSYSNQMVILIEEHPTEYWIYIPINNNAVNTSSVKELLKLIESYLNSSNITDKEFKIVQTNEKFKVVAIE